MVNKSKKIFIIEDNYSLRKILMDILKNEGYKVKGVSSAEEALVVLPKFRPDLFILDIKLKRRSGISMFEEITRYGSGEDVPVIIISGYINKIKEVKKLVYKNRNRVFYIEKPFGTDILLEVIEDVFKRKKINFNDKSFKGKS